MDIVYLVVGVVVGGLLGYLWAARKSVSLRSELQMNQQHAHRFFAVGVTDEPTACPGFAEGGKGTC